MTQLGTTPQWSVTRVRLAVADGPAQRVVTAIYNVKVARVASGPLLLDYEGCPLGILDIASADVSPRGLWSETGQYCIALEARHRKLPRHFELRITLEWPQSNRGGDYPLISFPQFLPRPAAAKTLAGSYLDAPLFVAPGSLDLSSVIGVQLRAGTWNPLKYGQRQIAFIDPAVVTFMSPDLLIAQHRHASGPDAHHDAIARDHLAVRQFLAEVLGVSPSARYAVLTEGAPRLTHLVPGTVLAGDAAFTGIDSGDLRVLSSQGVERIAAAWWHEGIRVAGHSGAALTTAIRQALVLYYLLAREREAHLSYFRDRMARQASTMPASDAGISAHGFQYAMQVALRVFEALRSHAAARRRLRSLTTRLWGRNVAADVLVRRLDTLVGGGLPTMPAGLASEMRLRSA